ncbi:MAG: protein phosphatase 2C domain-containing protein [Aliidongia sp.]
MSCRAPTSPFARSGALALIADGMGGHAAGEVASAVAVDIIRRRYYELAGTVPDVLAASFEAANRAIYERNASNAKLAGMGTTCTVFAVRDGLIYLGHVGDSRAYILRDGRLRQISQDHSVVAELVRHGTITAAEASRSPYRNIVPARAGHQTDDRAADLARRHAAPFRRCDRAVLRRLSDRLDDAGIAEIVGRLPPPEACQALISAALARGASDNISLGVFTVTARDTRAREPVEPARAASVV